VNRFGLLFDQKFNDGVFRATCQGYMKRRFSKLVAQKQNLVCLLDEQLYNGSNCTSRNCHMQRVSAISDLMRKILKSDL
jgi:hypothetical protein